MSCPNLYPAPYRHEERPGAFPAVLLETPAVEIVPGCVPAQGYRMEAGAEGVRVRAADAAGAFYARQTLKQLRRLARGGECGCFAIEDWPAVLERGIMLETLSGAIPKFERLKAFVEWMAEMKLNVLALYLENTFAFRDHEAVWQDASPYTHEQIMELDAFCRERFIELIPYQETFGHMHQWLKHPQYRPMAEVPEGWNHGFAVAPQPFTLCPSDPRSIEFLDGLYREIHEVFSSRKMLVGCDETDDLGKGRSRELCERVGRENVYIDFVNQIDARVRALGCETQIFGDVVIKHPETLGRLHPEVVIAHWGYESDYPFEEHCRLFQASGRAFYLLPSTSSYHSFIGRTDRGMGNIRNAVRNAVRFGARGVVNTQWGYRYNLTTLFDLPLFAFGAGMCWQPDANDSEERLADALDAHLFGDERGRLGRFLLKLGRAYNPVASRPNGFNPLYLSYCNCTVGKAHPQANCDPEALRGVLARVRESASEAEGLSASSPRWPIWREGLRFGLAMFLLCGDALQALLDDASAQRCGELPASVRAPLAARFREMRGWFERLWHVDNRPGGVRLTLEWYDNMLAELG
jgi:hypothetical protein